MIHNVQLCTGASVYPHENVGNIPADEGSYTSCLNPAVMHRKYNN